MYADFSILYKENVYMKTIYLFIFGYQNYITETRICSKKISIKNYSKFNLQTEKDPFNEYWDKITYLKLSAKALVQFKVLVYETTQSPQKNESEDDHLCRREVLK